MKLRPKIKIGDIVKLSKKGRKHPREFSSNATLVVSEIIGDGIDRSSVITCRAKVREEYKYFKFYRSELWVTGKNAFNPKTIIKVINCNTSYSNNK
jgi:hypothetical protein